MTTKFTYYILYYYNSILKKDRIGVGILFYFKELDYIAFKHSKSLKSIKEVYHNFKEWQIKVAFDAINEKIRRLNNDKGLFSEVIDEKDLANNVLLEDSTVLRFSAPNSSFSEKQNPSDIIDDYYDLYFSDLGVSIKREKRDENYILRKFKQKLQSENLSAVHYLQKDTIIEVPKTRIKFDYTWYNGRPNLIKPISFDLEEESSINHKAILLYGQINFASQLIEKYGASVNFLITSPKGEQSELFDAYKNAVEILKETKVRKDIIEEVNFDNYIRHISSEIHAPDQTFPKRSIWTGRSDDIAPPTLPLIG